MEDIHHDNEEKFFVFNNFFLTIEPPNPEKRITFFFNFLISS